MRRTSAVAALLSLVACAPEAPLPPPVSWVEVFAGLDSVPAAVDSAGSADSFGSVDAAVTLSDGGTVVIDGMNGLVRLLRDGVQIDASGGPGDGPKEFRMIRRAALGRGDSVIVLDQARHRLAVLRADRDSLAWAGDTVLPLPVADFCTIGGRLFFAAQGGAWILHEGTTDGQVLTSFGGPEGDDLLSQALSGVGTLACSADAQELAFVSMTLGIARIFSLDGRELRRDSIPGFVRTIYEVTGNAMRPKLPEQGYAHSVSSVQWLGRSLLVQLSRGPISVGAGQDTRLWLADGTWVSELPQWPRIVDVTHDTALVATIDDPYPRLMTYRIR